MDKKAFLLLGGLVSASCVFATTYTPEGYVADGLMACYDGILNAVDDDGKAYHDPAATTWANLVTRTTTRTAAVRGDETVDLATPDVNGFAFSLEKQYFTETVDGYVEACAENGGYTIEMAFTAEANNKQGMYAQAGSIGFYTQGYYQFTQRGKPDSSSKLYRFGAMPKAATFKRQSVRSTVEYSTELARYFEDGALCTVAANPAWTGTYLLSDVFYVGNKVGNGQNAKGTIHTARFYNRQLTDEEVAHNARIDQMRFALGQADQVRGAPDGSRIEYLMTIGKSVVGGTVKVNGSTVTEGDDVWVGADEDVSLEVVPPAGHYLLQVDALPETADVSGNVLTFRLGDPLPGVRVDCSATQPTDLLILPKGDLYLHFDATRTETVVADDYGRVTEWRPVDVPRASFLPWSNLTSAAQPYYSATAVGGKPGVVLGKVTNVAADGGVSYTAGQTALRVNEQYALQTAFVVLEQEKTPFHSGNIFWLNGGYGNDGISGFAQADSSTHLAVPATGLFGAGLVSANGELHSDPSNCVARGTYVNNKVLYAAAFADCGTGVANVLGFVRPTPYVKSDSPYSLLGCGHVQNKNYTTAHIGELITYRGQLPMKDILRVEQGLIMKWRNPSAATHTFVGDGSWQRAANWSNGVVPDADDLAIVPAGKSVTLAADACVRALVVEGALSVSDAKLTIGRLLVANDGAALAFSNATLRVENEWNSFEWQDDATSSVSFSGDCTFCLRQGCWHLPKNTSLSGTLVKEGLGDWKVCSDLAAGGCALDFRKGRFDLAGHALSLASFAGEGRVYSSAGASSLALAVPADGARLTASVAADIAVTVGGTGRLAVGLQRENVSLAVGAGATLAADDYASLHCLAGARLHVDAMNMTDFTEVNGIAAVKEWDPSDIETTRALNRNWNPRHLQFVSVGSGAASTMLPPPYSATALGGKPGVLFGADAAAAYGFSCAYSTNILRTTFGSGEVASNPPLVNMMTFIVCQCNATQANASARLLGTYQSWDGLSFHRGTNPYLTTEIPFPQDGEGSGGRLHINGKALYDYDRGIGLDCTSATQFPVEAGKPMLIAVSFPESMRGVSPKTWNRGSVATWYLGIEAGSYTYQFSGVISEVIMLENAPTDAEIVAVERALMKKWGITPDADMPAASERLASGTELSLGADATVDLGGGTQTVAKVSVASTDGATVGNGTLVVAGALQTVSEADGRLGTLALDGDVDVRGADFTLTGPKPTYGSSILRTKGTVTGPFRSLTPVDAPVVYRPRRIAYGAQGLMLFVR